MVQLKNDSFVDPNMFLLNLEGCKSINPDHVKSIGMYNYCTEKI